MLRKVCVVLVVLCAVVSPASADVTGSALTSVFPGSVSAGGPLDVQFTFEYSAALESADPADYEYSAAFSVTLPGSWVINSVGAAPSANSGCILPASVASGAVGQVVSWYGVDLPDMCGAWAVGEYSVTVNVTVSSCDGSPWALPWSIEGDGYGTAPHSVSGSYPGVGCIEEIDWSEGVGGAAGLIDDLGIMPLVIAGGVVGAFGLLLRRVKRGVR